MTPLHRQGRLCHRRSSRRSRSVSCGCSPEISRSCRNLSRRSRRRRERPVRSFSNRCAPGSRRERFADSARSSRHHKLGYRANGMAVFAVPEERVDAAGARLAERNEVSHCYRRPRLADWPYDLFAMVHGRSEEQVRAFVRQGRAGLGSERLRHPLLNRGIQKAVHALLRRNLLTPSSHNRHIISLTLPP